MLHAPARRHAANTERVADHGQIRRTLGPLRGPSIVDTMWNPLHAPAQLLEEANEHAAKAERAVDGGQNSQVAPYCSAIVERRGGSASPNQCFKIC